MKILSNSGVSNFHQNWIKFETTEGDIFEVAQTTTYNSNSPISKPKNTSRKQRLFPRSERKTEAPNKAVVGDTKRSKEDGAGGRRQRAETERLQSADRTPMTHGPQSRRYRQQQRSPMLWLQSADWWPAATCNSLSLWDDGPVSITITL